MSGPDDASKTAKTAEPAEPAEPAEYEIMPYDHLSKFERVQLIAARVEQLASGADTLLPMGAQDVPLETIAERELDRGMLPFLIGRHMPDGRYRTFRVVAVSAR